VEQYGFVRRRARTLMLAIMATWVPLAEHAGAAEETDTVNACVGFQNEEGDKLLTVHASNACDRKLACRLDYVLRCESDKGEVTSKSSKRQLFRLAAKGAQDLSLSAASCKQGWAIDELAWSCA
jgi:hypothetical protein